MKLQGAYHCVIGSAHQYLRHVYGIPYPIDLMVMGPDFFKLHEVNGKLYGGSHPQQTVARFLEKIEARMEFPEFSNVDGALTFAEEHVRMRGVLPVSINLRYSVLDPTAFDQDEWNFQLITGVTDDGYEMFDVYNGKGYRVERSHLLRMIDTVFNFRHHGRFTPFMTIYLDAPGKAGQILGSADRKEIITSAIAEYPLQDNIASIRAFTESLQSLYAQSSGKALHDDIYRIMGCLILIVRSRELLIQTIQHCGLSHTEELEALVKQWNDTIYMTPMAMNRKTIDDYRHLLHRMTELIDTEYSILQKLAESWKFTYGAAEGGIA